LFQFPMESSSHCVGKPSFLKSSLCRTFCPQKKLNNCLSHPLRCTLTLKYNFVKPRKYKILPEDGNQNLASPKGIIVSRKISILKKQSSVIFRDFSHEGNFENTPQIRKTPGNCCQTSFATEYRISHVLLGKGSVSKIYKCIHLNSGSLRAVKFLKNHGNRDAETIAAEVSILKSLSHKNVLHFYEFFVENLYVFLVTDLYAGGDLRRALLIQGSFTEEDVFTISKQLLRAVSHCHKNRIVHRDIQPANIVFKYQGSMEIVLVDFGLAKQFPISEKIQMQSIVGDQYYVAPEIIRSTSPYSEKCDEWSVGVVLFETVCGFTPFYGNSCSEVCASILSDNLHFPGRKWSLISKSLKDLISLLLIKNPAERIAVRSALSTLQLLSNLGRST